MFLSDTKNATKKLRATNFTFKNKYMGSNSEKCNIAIAILEN